MGIRIRKTTFRTTKKVKMLERKKKNAQVDIQNKFENEVDDYSFKNGYLRAVDTVFFTQNK